MFARNDMQLGDPSFVGTTITEAMRKIVQEEGGFMRGLYRGYSVTFFRAFLSNAVIFAVVRYLNPLSGG